MHAVYFLLECLVHKVSHIRLIVISTLIMSVVCRWFILHSLDGLVRICIEGVVVMLTETCNFSLQSRRNEIGKINFKI